MESYKCSKTEVYRIIANVLQNAPAKKKIEKKKTIETEKKETKAKLEAVAAMRKTYRY